MNPQLPPYIQFGKSDPQYKREMRSYFSGTCQTAWNFLTAAAASNVAHTLVGAKKLINFYWSAIARKQPPGETIFLAGFTYQSMSGPALGSIISSTAALESFLRFLGRTHFEHNISKGKRGRGVSKAVAVQIEEFDKRPLYTNRPSAGKVNYLFDVLLHQNCPKKLSDDIKELVSFRNEVLHADPALRTWSGQKKSGSSLDS